jgi:predicted porin
VRLAVEAQLGNGGNNTGTGNAFEGNIGFDYMGFSMDFLGGHISDAVSAAPLAVGAISTVPVGNGQIGATVSDNTVFQAAARYTIGPWKLFGGYEWIQFANPQNAIAAGSDILGGFIAATVNNTNFPSDKILQTAWFGARYSITPALDITGAYYHEWQNTFATNSATLAGCAALRSSSSMCSGTEDMVSLVVDWRFARHVDMYAGIAYSQVQGGLANGFIVNSAGATVNGTGGNKSSNYDPGVGLRYQF